MPSKYLRDGDRIIRYVPYGKLRRDDDDNVIGVLPQAFELRSSEEYLSATWCEYFEGEDAHNLKCAVGAIRDSALKVTPKAQFAVGQTKAVKDHMAAGGRKIRIIHEEEDDNPAHAALRQWSNEDADLLAGLADDIWCELYTKEQIDEIETVNCEVSEYGKAKV